MNPQTNGSATVHDLAIENKSPSPEGILTIKLMHTLQKRATQTPQGLFLPYNEYRLACSWFSLTKREAKALMYCFRDQGSLTIKKRGLFFRNGEGAPCRS